MAVEFDVKGSRTSEYRFLPEYLEVSPELNGRHDKPDIQTLITSILEHGQLQPVTIRRGGGKPILVAGFSRWRAITEINAKKMTEKPLELRCSYTALTEKQAFLANIAENRDRNPTSPMDDAYNIQRLVNVYQMTEQECADTYRASVAWVKSRLQLIEATPALEKVVRAGKVTGTVAQAIAKLNKQHQNNLAKVAEEKGKVTAADIQREVGAPAKSKPKDVLELADAACRLMIDDEISIDEAQKAAKAYLKARGL